jgi:hypothetical protein
VKDCRLRAYDALMKVRLAVYDAYESTLLNVKNMRTTLDLEMKDDLGNFQAYEADWVYLKAVQWQPNTTFDFTKPESNSAHVVKVHSKKNTISDLEATLSAEFGIPQDKLII